MNRAACRRWLPFALFIFVGTGSQVSGQDRPNVLIIIIDDLGCRDIGIEGSSFHETPNLDALARSGVRFTNFYSAHPVCSPTRAALMTGKVPQRVGITDWIHPSSGIALPKEEITLAETFQKQGYQTAYLGKWHLGEDDANLPTRHGFEWIKCVNRAGQPASYYFPFKRSNGSTTVYDVPDLEDAQETDYLTDVLTTKTIEFLKSRSQDRPFFLCLGHYSIHTPIQPPRDLPAKYRDKAKQAYGKTKTPILDAPNESLSRGRQDNADYAAMMENLDNNIGRLLRGLEETGQRDNTIVVFTSDNGGLCTLKGKNPGPTCNLLLRSGKGWTYEGGIRISTFISWPKQIKPAICDVPGYTADFYPTLLELCGMSPLPQQHLDGRSLAGVIRGQLDTKLQERAIAWYYPHDHGSGHKPSAAIRKGKWKLILDLNTGSVQLFDLLADPSELKEISPAQPDIAKSLTKELRDWIAETTKGAGPN